VESKLDGKLIGGLIIIAFSIVLLNQPRQPFTRNGTQMVKKAKTDKSYKRTFNLLGFILLIIGIIVLITKFL
jgi:uncharacterized membrane protein